MPSPEERLTELGLSVPEVAKPVAEYVPAVRTGNHGKLETMQAMVEEVSATLGAITLLLDAWSMKDTVGHSALMIDVMRQLVPAR